MMKKFLWILLFILVIASVIMYFVFNYTYSEGSRAGVLIKFSRKGYLFKTYEGELNLGGVGNIPNTAQFNQIWVFSVNDGSVADTLMKLEGHKVALHYREIVKAMPWKGETNHFVTGVEVLD
jgi:hypothetical protein